MEVFEAIMGRRSIRKYKPDAVSDEVIEQVLDAAHWAPAPGNRRHWRFIVVKDEGTRRLLKALSPGLLADPPVIIVVCMEWTGSEDVGDIRVMVEGASAAIQNMFLAAYNLGLGTCWIGRSVWEEVKSILDVPEKVEVLALIMMGYPAEQPSPPPRPPLNEVIFRERYHGRWKA